MDPKKCIEILCGRMKCNHIESSDNLENGRSLCYPCSNLNNSESIKSPDLNQIKDMNILDLLNLFGELQSQRVQSYRDYDTALDILIEQSRISEYSFLCAEMTARFSTISGQIIQLIAQLREKSLTVLSSLIQKIQNEEKEKLTLIASIHIDKIVTAFPSMKPHFGTECQTLYLTSRIKDIEKNIAEHMETIQVEKCEYI